MNILFLTDNFYPETNAPAKRTLEHCKEWSDLGHNVTVITGAPNFPKGKVFKGYKNRLYQSELVNNLTVKRVWTFITANKGFLLRIIDYISFMVSSLVCGIFTKKHDVIIATSPQFFTLISGYFISLFKRTPLVLEIRDLWPESIVAVGIIKESSWVITILHKIAFFLYSRSTMVICVTESFKKDLIKKGVDKNKIFVVENGFNLDTNLIPNKSIKEIESQYNIKQEDFTISFTGTVGMAHGLEIILNSAKTINKKMKFLIIGDGASRSELLEQAKKEQLDNINFISNISWQEIVNLNQLIDMHLVHLIDNPEFRKVIPSKIFESMALKKPVIMGVLGESRDIIDKASCGINITPENHRELNAVINNYLDKPDTIKKMGGNGYDFVNQEYSRKKMAKKMIEFIEDRI
jgi:glycosyltransferase involved in cell wall biosynthesis